MQAVVQFCCFVFNVIGMSTNSVTAMLFSPTYLIVPFHFRYVQIVLTDASAKEKKKVLSLPWLLCDSWHTKHASTYCSLCRIRANQYASAKTLDIISVKMQGGCGIQPTLYTRIVEECTIPTCLRLFCRSPIHVQESLHCQQMVRSQGPIKREVRREVFEVHTVLIERSARTRGSLDVGGCTTLCTCKAR